jgi:UDP-N-acetylglucosamine 2-epimerase (non-hydrolysing)
MKIAVVFGTRPEIIKLSPVIRELEKRQLEFFIIHTNQHYDQNMDEIFLDELNLPKAKYNLGIGSGTHANMTGRMLIKVEKIFQEEQPDVLIVQGDTNTVLSMSLAATKMHIKVAHVEAGLRSYTKIPEETNRVLTDRISDYCFVPTQKQQDILINEGIEKEKIHITGNTIVDAVLQNLELAESNTKSPKDPYILLTTHREENVDNTQILETILKATSDFAKKHSLKVFLPLHPRTKNIIEKNNIEIPQEIETSEPVGYLEMLQLIKNARIIFTDSGGIQEEACILKIPCITLRESTERPETVDVGGNVIVGTKYETIIEEADKMLTKEINWTNPFGDGTSAEQIVNHLG